MLIAAPPTSAATPNLFIPQVPPYQIAFQANGTLWYTGFAGIPQVAGAATGTTNTGLGMKPGTSPSTVFVSGKGNQIAFQADTGDLWTAGPSGTGDLG
jgi:hypothetical protein